MKRREIITTLASFSVGLVPTVRSNTTDTTSAINTKKHRTRFSLAKTTDTDDGWVPLDDKINARFTVESNDTSAAGSDDVNVLWVDEEVLDKKGYPWALALAQVGGNKILLNSDQSDRIGHRAMHHELAHCLGYRHSDAGIMSLQFGSEREDQNPDVELAESTRRTAEVFDGLQYFDWDIDDLADMGDHFAQGDVNVARLGYAGQRFASSAASAEDIFYTSDWDMFGGYKDTTQDGPTQTILTHMFYGLPVED